MEVEDDQLEIYRAGQRTLTQWMDLIFESADANSPEVREAVRQIQAWCFKKREAALAPFQEIRHVFKRPFTVLRPVVAGHSVRIRSHVYGEGSVWMMEASLDRAMFRALAPQTPSLPPQTAIFELEVENKFSPPSKGTEMMNRLEDLLTTHHGLKPGLDSKYRQSAKVLFGITL